MDVEKVFLSKNKRDKTEQKIKARKRKNDKTKIVIIKNMEMNRAEQKNIFSMLFKYGLLKTISSNL